MKDKIEENDFGFVEQWSRMVKLDCGTLFVNPSLPDDHFFNKLTQTCINEKTIIKAIDIFQKNHTHTFVYVLNDQKLEDFLKQKNFIFFDTQHVLINTAQQDVPNHPVTLITKQNSLLWSEIFCKSYDCYEWIDEVNHIVKNSCTKIDYLVDANYNASCVALYEKNSILGLYCLGTLPGKRKKGIAKSLVEYALNRVKIKKLDFLMLETYMQDNLLEFYSKLGFNKVYEKKIYTK
jgi:ribosomal protein S18 acetylase RimI-like enzyme